ncbi:hypothetical protein [Vulcanisaeta souniana]|uniref:Uncharacterized protein n=1 Tax=Vulcanisaeta souniana JCM 11219 TaxID=1293586 RepID=A0A830E8N0_9CREN|nr:hypothetical protein [Vulcanisaeta souniana]BDR92624.1 hypothetical protein Vsou_17170 [Vulcanisaeta souniana JCM 11219]GGI82443.1 hypothetical protein GCM10007112_18980 [Vulcanisaeta souniana JCM 11219]
MSVVLYLEGTVIAGGKGEVRIYVKKRYWDRLKPFIGKEVKLLMVVEDEGSQDAPH